MRDAAEAASTPCRLVPSGRVWLCDDDLGVSRGSSNALAHDARGYLWIGSERGPVRFDGLAWETPASLAPLGACVVRGLAQAPDGALWVATDNVGLARIDLDTTPYRITTRLTVADGLPSDTVGALCVDRRGQVWAATNGGVALIRDGRPPRRFTVADGLPSERAWTICHDYRDRVWVGTKGGLALIAGETVMPVDTADAAGHPRGVHVVCHDPRGHILVGLMDGSVCRVVETATETETGWALAPLVETGARVRALCPDEDGGLWIGASTGVLLLRDGVVADAWAGADGLPVQGVWALCRDRGGRVWASTSAGLALIAQPPPLARSLPPAAGAPQGLVFACQPDDQGRVWIASEQGLSAVDEAGEASAPLPPLPAAVMGQLVWALRLDHQGRLWVGTDRAGLLCLDPATGALLAQVAAGHRVPALCLEEDGARRLWASVAAEGVLCVDVETQQVVHRVGRAQGLPSDVVYGMHTDRQGRLWVGTWAGELVTLDTARGAVVATLTLNDDQTQRPIVDLADDAAGQLWCATYGGGLVCVDPARRVVVEIITTREGAPSDILYSCLADAHGDLWLGTPRGVARYRPEDARWAVVGRGLGLPSEECNARALHLDGRAQLWVGTVGGMGLVVTERMSADIAPCPVYLTSLAVMGEERALAPDLEIEDSDYDLLFTYGAVAFAFAGPAQVVYRVRLEGLEVAWSAPTTQRTARYTNLHPGAYTFRVAARDWGGRWSEPVEVPFRVVRNRKAQEMDEALERERIDKEVYRATADRLGELNSRLQDLNRQLEETDQLKTTLIQQTQEQAALFERLARQDGLTGLLNRRALDARLADECGRARRHGGALTVALADLDHFKGINDTYGHQVGDRVLKIAAQLCRDTVRSEDIAGRYGGEEIALILPETTAASAWDICERLRLRIAAYDWGDVAAGLRVTASIGLSSEGGPALRPDNLLADADAALYQAKAGGRDLVVSFDGVANAGPAAPLAKLAAVRRLLAEGRVDIHFQPIWDLPRGIILAYEALMRPAPDYGLTGPREAFEIAERLGHVQTLDALCRRAALRAATALPPQALLFLNLTPHTLDHGLLAASTLVDEARAAGLAPERVVLEIAERSAPRPGGVTRAATRLRDLGFRIALDDIGAGGAGLEVLSRMPVDFVKIDRAVVGRAPNSAPDRAVLAGILAMAGELGAYVIAEGIETADVLRFVRRMGASAAPGAAVQGAQGYLLGHPSAHVPDTVAVARHKVVIAVA